MASLPDCETTATAPVVAVAASNVVATAVPLAMAVTADPLAAEAVTALPILPVSLATPKMNHHKLSNFVLAALTASNVAAAAVPLVMAVNDDPLAAVAVTALLIVVLV